MPYLRAHRILQLSRAVRVFHMQSMYIARQSIHLVILLNDLVDAHEGPDDEQHQERIDLEDELIELFDAMKIWGANSDEGSQVDYDQSFLTINQHYARFFRERFYFHKGRSSSDDLIYAKILAYDRKTIDSRESKRLHTTSSMGLDTNSMKKDEVDISGWSPFIGGLGITATSNWEGGQNSLEALMPFGDQSSRKKSWQMMEWQPEPTTWTSMLGFPVNKSSSLGGHVNKIQSLDMLGVAFGPGSTFPNEALAKLLNLITASTFCSLQSLEPTIDSADGQALLSMISDLPGCPSAAFQQSIQSIYTLLVDTTTYKCLMCGLMKKSRESVIGCVRSHLNHRPFVCESNLCGSCRRNPIPARFFTTALLQDHIKVQVQNIHCTYTGWSVFYLGCGRPFDSFHHYTKQYFAPTR